MKKLLNLFSKKKPENPKEMPVSEISFNEVVPTLSFFDFVGPTGFDIPASVRDRGYINEGPIGDYPFRTFILEFGTTSLSTGQLDSLYRAGAVNVMCYWTKLTKAQAVRTYKNAITDEGARLKNMMESGNDIEVREVERSLGNAHRLLDEVSEGYNDGFLGTVVVTVFAQDEKTLDLIGTIMQDNLIGNDHHLRVLYNRQRSGFKSTLPIGNNCLQDKNDRRFFDRTAIVAASPFYSSEIPFSLGSVPVGINMHTGKMEFLNVFAKYLPNYSSLIVGASGSGKSFSNKFISSSQILLGYRIFSIDPDGENGPICRLLGGTEVEVREGGNVCINVCALTEEEVEVTDELGRRSTVIVVPLASKIGQLLKFYDRLLGEEMTSEEEFYIKEAINQAFQQAGITEDPASLYETSKTPVQTADGEIRFEKRRKPEVTLTDIYRFLIKNNSLDYDLETLTYSAVKRPSAERILTTLRGYLRDYPDGRMLDGQTNFGDGRSVDGLLDNVKWVNFNIKSIESSKIFDVMMFVITLIGWEYFVKRPSLRGFRKRLKIEEAWKMKRIPGAMQFVEDLARRSRKYNAGADIITQDLTPFLNDEDGQAIIKNATSAVFLMLGQINLEEKIKLKNIFNFSEGELEVICRKPPEDENDDSRGEAILRVGGSSAFVKVTVDEKIRRFIDTDPDWLQSEGLLPGGSL